MNDEVQKWYALQVRSRFEKVVSMHLQGKGYRDYLPLYKSRRRWSDRVKEIEVPLFPGYVFCKFDVRDKLPILVIPGVMTVVSFGSGAISIPDHEIDGVQNIVNSGLMYGPFPFMSSGTPVRVRYGPLRGLEGQVVEVKNTYQLIISITMLSRSVSVAIDRDNVTPLNTQYATAVS
jgi:transcription antitermination factor NusG